MTMQAFSARIQKRAQGGVVLQHVRNGCSALVPNGDTIQPASMSGMADEMDGRAVSRQITDITHGYIAFRVAYRASL